MAQNCKLIKAGKFTALYFNTVTKYFEIWQIYENQYEVWDDEIPDKEEGLSILRYAEKHYMDK